MYVFKLNLMKRVSGFKLLGSKQKVNKLLLHSCKIPFDIFKINQIIYFTKLYSYNTNYIDISVLFAQFNFEFLSIFVTNILINNFQVLTIKKLIKPTQLLIHLGCLFSQTLPKQTYLFDIVLLNQNILIIPIITKYNQFKKKNFRHYFLQYNTQISIAIIKKTDRVQSNQIHIHIYINSQNQCCKEYFQNRKQKTEKMQK
eukprot:TRINITY_DN6560_c0_g2_i4.p2 TRINITY_DN6560_c0_g2~~TRINITY_DN6560_c0_g2_i4.p2  ORF type:complete len:200 (-),score=-22.72 TRINITY_DN6560_c0_g2_i4:1721-2320(-)